MKRFNWHIVYEFIVCLIVAYIIARAAWGIGYEQGFNAASSRENYWIVGE